MDNKKDVSLRSIENWRRGKLPRRNNIHALARVFGGDHEPSIVLWREALIKCLEAKKGGGAPGKPAAFSEAPEINSKIIKEPQRHVRAAFISAVLSSILTAIVIFFGLLLTDNLETHKHAVAKNIKFCTEEQFDKIASVCLVNMDEFPHKTELIFVSFTLNDSFEGQRFDRVWMRNGERFLKKTSFNHEAWSGYTYIKNPYGHDPGQYVLEVSINDKATSASFTVGKAKS